MKNRTFILRIVLSLLLIVGTLSFMPVYIYVTVFVPKQVDIPSVKELKQDICSSYESVSNMKLIYSRGSNKLWFELKGKDISDSEMFSIILMIRDLATQSEFQESLPAVPSRIYLYCYDSAWDSGNSKAKYEFTARDNNHSNPHADDSAPRYSVWEGIKYYSDHYRRITMDMILARSDVD